MEEPINVIKMRLQILIRTISEQKYFLKLWEERFQRHRKYGTDVYKRQVLDGVFTRGCKVRISREGEQIFEGNLASLKRFKDDVKEVKAGFECGLVFEGFDKMQEFDIVEAYTMVEVPR